jgi:hypothetical protein
MKGNLGWPKILVGAAVLQTKALSFQEIYAFTDDFFWSSPGFLPGWSV